MEVVYKKKNIILWALYSDVGDWKGKTPLTVFVNFENMSTYIIHIYCTSDDQTIPQTWLDLFAYEISGDVAGLPCIWYIYMYDLISNKLLRFKLHIPHERSILVARASNEYLIYFLFIDIFFFFSRNNVNPDIAGMSIQVSW